MKKEELNKSMGHKGLVKKIRVIILFALVFSLLSISIRIIANNSLSIALVGLIGAILGAFIGLMVTEIISSQDMKRTPIRNNNSIDEIGVLLVIIISVLSWQVSKYFFGNSLIVRLVGLIIGFYLGIWIAKLFRKFKKE